MHNEVITQMVNIVDVKIDKNRIKVLHNLGLIIKDLQAKLDDRECFIDAQVILDYLTSVTETDEDPNVVPESVIEKATVWIEWIDGIPAVSGLPLWERLDCESMDFYKVFKIYRDQKYIGTTKNRYQRSFENLKETTGLSREALYAVSLVYHWQMRVTYYDSFHEETIEKEKARLITLMETRHLAASENIFEKCIAYFKDIDETKMKTLAPKDVLAWWNEAVKLNRLSLGLPGDKVIADKSGAKVGKVINITRNDNKTLNG